MSAETISKNLQTHLGKDAFLRIVLNIGIVLSGIFAMASDVDLKAENLPYLSFLARGYFDLETMIYIANTSEVIARHFILARLIVRFTDDFPTLYVFWRYVRSHFLRYTKKQSPKKLKKQTVNSYLRWVFLINLFSNIIYNPCEHIAWLGELKVINASDQLWYFYTNVAWAFGLFTSVLINLRVVNMFYSQKATKAKREDDPNYDSSEIISESDMKLSMNYAIRDFADWCIAIHFMPEGFLWSGQLYYYQVGILGVISSWCRVETYVLSKQ